MGSAFLYNNSAEDIAATNRRLALAAIEQYLRCERLFGADDEDTTHCLRTLQRAAPSLVWC